MRYQLSSVILDRDGVINYDSASYIKSPAEWIPIPGSLQAIARLTRAGVRVLVATNQANLGRGVMSQETLDAIHARLHRAVEQIGGHIERIYVCPHRPEDACACRKPEPGLLLAAARDYSLDLAAVPYIADSLTDIQAAIHAGARPVLVRTGNGRATEATLPAPAIPVYDDLSAAVEDMLGLSTD